MFIQSLLFRLLLLSQEPESVRLHGCVPNASGLIFEFYQPYVRFFLHLLYTLPQCPTEYRRNESERIHSRPPLFSVSGAPIAMVPMPVISTTVSRIKKFFLAFLDFLTIRLLFLPSMFTPPKYRTYFLFVLIIYEHTFFVNYFLYFNEHRFDFVPFLCYNMVTSIFLPIGQSTRK